MYCQHCRFGQQWLDILLCYELSIYPTKIMRHIVTNPIMWMQHFMHLCLVTEKLQQQQNVTLTICHRTDSSSIPPGGQLPKPANPGGGLEHLGSPRRVHKPGATLGEGGACSTNNPHWAASTTTGASVSTTPGANCSVILSIYYYSELNTAANGSLFCSRESQLGTARRSRAAEVIGRKKIIPYHPSGSLFWVCCRYENAMCAGKGLGSTVTMEGRWVQQRTLPQTWLSSSWPT